MLPCPLRICSPGPRYLLLELHLLKVLLPDSSIFLGTKFSIWDSGEWGNIQHLNYSDTCISSRMKEWVETILYDSLVL